MNPNQSIRIYPFFIVFRTNMWSKESQADSIKVDMWGISTEFQDFHSSLMVTIWKLWQDVVRNGVKSFDWWFRTFFIFPHIEHSHPNWLIFFRGIETTNQSSDVAEFRVIAVRKSQLRQWFICLWRLCLMTWVPSMGHDVFPLLGRPIFGKRNGKFITLWQFHTTKHKYGKIHHF